MRNEVDSMLFESVKQYTINKHKSEILAILEDPGQESHYAITIHFVLLLEVCPMACEAVLANSAKYLQLFDEALVEAANEIYNMLKGEKESTLMYTHKKLIHFRIVGLPLCPDIESSTMPKLKDNGRFLSIQGTVIKSTQPKILEFKKEFTCIKCKYQFLVSSAYDQYNSLKFPSLCPNTKKCKGTKFQPVTLGAPEYRKDYQEIKVQEPLSKLGVGVIPSSIWVTLEDDLVDKVKPGDDVTVCGLVSYRWMPVVKNQRASIEVVVKGNSVSINNNATIASDMINDDLIKYFRTFWVNHASDPLAARNFILSSFAPQIYGLYLIKLAAAVVISGGVTRNDESGIKSRGESHLLLVGDPGAGKSQILKYISKLCPRSVLTTGTGTTSAGLTVSATKESGTWHLEAGALVMADGGVCCIDEFGSIQEKDRASIHEAMEQQTISVAKAGIVCKLNTRCTIVAVTNPKGGFYDPGVNLNVNTGLASPLLTRFDLIMVLSDKKESEWDRVVAQHILKQNLTCSLDKSSLWSFDLMKSYFSLIKNLKPVLSKEANKVLSKYYTTLRQADGRLVARTSVRMFESLIRLAQGHARLMFREKVTLMDALVVVILSESSSQSAALLDCGSCFHAAFPRDPAYEYYKQARVVLERLQLNELVSLLESDAVTNVSVLGFEASKRTAIQIKKFPEPEEGDLNPPSTRHNFDFCSTIINANQPPKRKLSPESACHSKRGRFCSADEFVESISDKASISNLPNNLDKQNRIDLFKYSAQDEDNDDFEF